MGFQGKELDSEVAKAYLPKSVAGCCRGMLWMTCPSLSTSSRAGLVGRPAQSGALYAPGGGGPCAGLHHARHVTAMYMLQRIT